MKKSARLCLAAAVMTGPAWFLPVSAQSAVSDAVPPYDLGYAAQASQACPNVTLLAKPDEAAKAAGDFKKGAAMFESYVKSMTAEGACKAAINLYHSETGKVAKLLAVK